MLRRTRAARRPLARPLRHDSGRHVQERQRQREDHGLAGLLRSVRALYPTTLWRHNQAGDLPHTGGTIDADMVAGLARANAGKRGFTYTHHNVAQSAANRDTVRAANAAGFTVNVSGNSLAHADQLAALDVAPVVAVLPVALERPSAKGQWLESLESYRAGSRT